MAKNTLASNIGQAVTDFADIKTAIIEKGVNVPGGTPTAEYDDLIRQIADVDLSNVVKFDSNRDVNLIGEGNILLDASAGILASDQTSDYTIAKINIDPSPQVISLLDVRVGDNLRGKTIQVNNTGGYPAYGDFGGELIANPVMEYGYLRISMESDIKVSYFYSGSLYEKRIYNVSMFAWEDTTITLPDEDYIVTQNTLYDTNTNINSWGWKDTSLEGFVRTNEVVIGSKQANTRIDSLDRPVWNNEQLAMLSDLSGGGNEDNIVVFEATETLFNGFEVYDTLTGVEFDKYKDAIINNKIIVFKITSTGATMRWAAATDARYTVNGTTQSIYLNFGVLQDRNTQTLCNINNNSSAIQRWFYAYEVPAHKPLIDNLNYVDAGIAALDARQGSVIKNMITAITPVILTQAEYDALGDIVNTNGITYYIIEEE